MTESAQKPVNPAGAAAEADDSLHGTSILLLYGFPGLLSEESARVVRENTTHVPPDPLFRMLPKAHVVGPSQPGLSEEEKLAWEFRSIRSVGLGDESMARYRLRKGQLQVSLGAGGHERPLDCEVFAVVHPAYEVGFLLVNIYGEGLSVDEVVALCHSGGGRNEMAEQEIGRGRRKRERAAELKIHFAPAAAAQPPSLRRVARECIRLFLREYQAVYGLTEPDDAALAAWEQSRLAEPMRCTEVKQQVRADGITHQLPDGSGTAPGGPETPQDFDSFSKQAAQPLYGLLATDEAWRFVPARIAAPRVAPQWGTRSFFSVSAWGRGVLMLNRRSKAYVDFHRDWWPQHFGFRDEYFEMNSKIAGLEHGPLGVLENCLISQALQHNTKHLIQDLRNLITEKKNPPTGPGQRVKTPPIGGKLVRIIRSRADMFSRCAKVTENLQKLVELHVREIEELGRLIRREQGLEGAGKTIKDELAEVDAELGVLEQELTNTYLLVLTVFTIVTAFIAILLAVPPFLKEFDYLPHRLRRLILLLDVGALVVSLLLGAGGITWWLTRKLYRPRRGKNNSATTPSRAG